MALGKTTPLHFGQGRRRRIQEQNEARDAFEAGMEDYRTRGAELAGTNVFADAKNVFAGAENVFAGAENKFANLENTFEDLRIDTTGAELAGSQFAQSQADTLAAVGAGVGGSGFGALTSSSARQAAQQAAQTRADLNRQAQANQMAQAQGAANVQMASAQGAADAQRMQMEGAAQQQQMILGGAAAAQQMRLQGAENALQRELSQMETQLGMDASRLQAANEARQQNTQMWMNLAGDVLSTAGTIASDRSIKQDIKLIGKSNSGINIYSFKYKDKKYGTGTYQGVMSDEVPSYAVVNNGEHDLVDYSLIDVEFKKL